MRYEHIEAKKINGLLGKNSFTGVASNDEVLEVTGLTIRELILCWIFEPRNNFTRYLSEWVKSGTLMNFEKIQEPKV